MNIIIGLCISHDSILFNEFINLIIPQNESIN
ncbi:MAG: hypothetical protein ACFE9Q_17640 [Candidatus Hodarchaeota archaeon]